MAAPVNNFRLVSVLDEAPPHLEEYDTIDDYQIYHSQHNLDIYVIYDHDYEVYRSIEFMGQNQLELKKNLNFYLNYYSELPVKDKTTISYYKKDDDDFIPTN